MGTEKKMAKVEKDQEKVGVKNQTMKEIVLEWGIISPTFFL